MKQKIPKKGFYKFNLLPLNHKDFPVKFKRVQFPIKICFAMTINQVQDQTLTYCGVDLENSFSQMDNCMWHFLELDDLTFIRLCTTKKKL